jgi:dephospho-CoA kinase
MQSKSPIKSKTFKVGITGGIGSGKTLISKVFEILGIPLYNADERAKWLVANNTTIKDLLIKNFGEQSFKDGKLNRSFISSIVFEDQQKLELLNSIIHPEVEKDFDNWVEQHRQYPYVLKEAALLFESGSYKKLDKIISVYSPVDLRIKRLLIRDTHRTKDDIEKIMQKQMDEEEKKTRADYVIYNDEKSMVIPQVLKLHEVFSEQYKLVKS